MLNLYANDGERLFEGATWAGHLAVGPVFLIAGTACAITLIGVWALIGLVIMLLIVLLQVHTLNSQLIYQSVFCNTATDPQQIEVMEFGH